MMAQDKRAPARFGLVRVRKVIEASVGGPGLQFRNGTVRATMNADTITTGQEFIERFHICAVQSSAALMSDYDLPQGLRNRDSVITKVEEVARDKNRRVSTDAMFTQVRTLARRFSCELAEGRSCVYAHCINQPVRPPGTVAADPDDPATNLGPTFDRGDLTAAHGTQISVNVRCESEIVVNAIRVMVGHRIARGGERCASAVARCFLTQSDVSSTRAA